MSTLFIILLVVSILFLALGFSIKYLKFYFLIAGYNTANEEDKKLIDIEGLSRLSGNYFLIIGIISLICTVFQYLKFDWALEIFIGVLVLTLPFLLWKAQKFDKKVANYKDNKAICIIVTIALFVFYALIMSLLAYTSQEQNISLSSDAIVIASPYSNTIYFKDIKDISLKNSLPKIDSKINGTDGINHVEKGSFNVSGIGKANLYIYDNVSPYILISTDSDYYLISYKDSAKTNKLYNEIISRLHDTNRK